MSDKPDWMDEAILHTELRAIYGAELTRSEIEWLTKTGRAHLIGYRKRWYKENPLKPEPKRQPYNPDNCKAGDFQRGFCELPAGHGGPHLRYLDGKFMPLPEPEPFDSGQFGGMP